MGAANMHDLAAVMDPAYGAANTAVTAGGAGDNTEVDGAYIDVTDAEGITFLIGFTATLGASETLQIAANAQDADDSSGTNVADFGDAISATTVATGPSGGGTVTGVAIAHFDAAAAKEFMRLQFTPNLSRANTDTAALSVTAVRGGAKIVPKTSTGVTRLN
jgi:hypothetical protein